MHLVIDVREACRKERAGKGQWTYGFVSELLKTGISLTLMTDAPLPSEWQGKAEEKRIPGSGFLWHLRAASFVRQLPPDSLYVSPTSFLVPFLVGSRARCVPIVHDLIAFRPEPHSFKARWIERLTLPRALHHAAQVCAISESTKKDVLERFPRTDEKKVTVIGAGPLTEHPAANVPDGKTILCVATLCPRKNQLRLIRAYGSLPADLRSRFRLILGGGRGWQDDEIVTLAGATPGVEWKGYVDDSLYEELLHRCTVLALPSLYEGFGMQVLDALQRGIPLLLSDRGSLREVAGDAALYVDPLSVDSIAKGLETLLRSEQMRRDFARKALVEAEKFSWKRTAETFLAAIRRG